MSIEYKGKKWDKEIKEFQKYSKEINKRFNNNELYYIKEFEDTGYKKYLRLYHCLTRGYRSMSVDFYQDNETSSNVVKYTYLSGMASVISKSLIDKGVQLDSIHNMIDINYYLFNLAATDEMSSPYLSIVKDNLIMLMYQQKYEEAEKILRDLPDNPKGEGCEWDYYAPSYLKPIYMAIINHDEKGFNAGLEKRIKKYRTNMVGYSVIVDVVSVALIKMAKKAGINCTVDVIEIPKQFFSEEKLIDTNECKLPYFDELLKSGLL